MNKQDLLARIQSGRQQLEDALARVGEEHMSLVILHGEWSAKDLIGHLGFWETNVVTLFQTLSAHKTPAPFGELDALNAKALQESRKLSLAEVRQQESVAYQEVLNLVAAAAPGELFDPAHFAWTEGRPFETFIEDNTCGHYEEHLPELTAWLKRIA